MNVAVMECYFLSRPFDEEGKPIRGFRKRMNNIWKERQGLKVTEQRLCAQSRMIRMNWWLTELEMNAIKNCMMKENANKNDQNSGNDDNDEQREATEKECENFANVQQNNVSLSFENIEESSEEEKIMIKNIIEIAEHNLEEKVNGFKKVNRNLLKDWTMKIKATLKGIKSENITGTNRLIRACAIFVGRKVGLKPKQRRGNPVKEPWWKRRMQ